MTRDGLAGAIAEIDRRLATATPPAARSRLTAAALRHLAHDYLHHRDDLCLRGLAAGRVPHWNLWAADADAPRTVFAVLIFRPTGLEFFCGTAPARELHDSLDAGIAPDPDEVYRILSRAFPIPEEPLRLDRPTAEAWLGRPRVC